MKPIYALLLAASSSVIFISRASAQANTSLSNLGTTSVSASLAPASDSLYNLGTATKSWKQLNFKDALYLGANRFISTGPGNKVNSVGIGFGSLGSVSTGTANTGLGYQTLSKVKYGRNNVAFGSSALLNSIGGNENTALGQAALINSSQGGSNIALGAYALNGNITGHSAVAIGLRASRASKTESYSVAIGDSALLSDDQFPDQPDPRTVAIGSKAGFLSTGFNFSWSVVVGYQAYAGSNGAGYLVGLGSGALLNTLSGGYAVAAGHNAMANSYYSREVVGIGENAFTNSNNTEGATGVGNNSLPDNVSTYYPTAVGYQSSGLDTTGIYIGAFAHGVGSAHRGATAIGYGAEAAQRWIIRFGNSDIVSIGGAVNWSVLSDARFKTNVQGNVGGLAFIRQLRPVTFHYDPAAIRNFSKSAKQPPASPGQTAADAAKAKIVYSGFIAQEVEAAAKKSGIEFSGVDKPKNDQDYYGLRMTDFVGPIVQAMKELIDSNNVKQKKIADQALRIATLKSRLDQVEALLKGSQTPAGKQGPAAQVPGSEKMKEEIVSARNRALDLSGRE